MKQTTLDGYTKDELHKIVSMYNLQLDIDKAKATKEQIKKSMMKVGKKKLVDLPSKEELKKKAPRKKKAMKEDKKQPKISKYVKKS